MNIFIFVQMTDKLNKELNNNSFRKYIAKIDAKFGYNNQNQQVGMQQYNVNNNTQQVMPQQTMPNQNMGMNNNIQQQGVNNYQNNQNQY